MTRDAILSNIVTRRPRLNERAADLTAECLFRFHRSLKGAIAPALKSRPGCYARRQVRGVKSLEVSDIADLVTIDGPHRAAARAAVRELLAPILERLGVELPAAVVEGPAVYALRPTWGSVKSVTWR